MIEGVTRGLVPFHEEDGGVVAMASQYELPGHLGKDNTSRERKVSTAGLILCVLAWGVSSWGKCSGRVGW